MLLLFRSNSIVDLSMKETKSWPHLEKPPRKNTLSTPLIVIAIINNNRTVVFIVIITNIENLISIILILDF